MLCLVRKTCNQVCIYACDASLLYAAEIRECNSTRMQAACGPGFLVYERLHSEADAIHAAFEHGLERVIGQLAGCTFHGDFCSLKNFKLISNCAEQRCEELRRQKAGCASAQVDGIQCICRCKCSRRLKVFGEAPDISLHVRGRKYARSEVAVGALGAAKRHGNIEAKRMHGGPLYFLTAALKLNCVRKAAICKGSAGRAEWACRCLRCLGAVGDVLRIRCENVAQRIYVLGIMAPAC